MKRIEIYGRKFNKEERCLTWLKSIGVEAEICYENGERKVAIDVQNSDFHKKDAALGTKTVWELGPEWDWVIKIGSEPKVSAL